MFLNFVDVVLSKNSQSLLNAYYVLATLLRVNICRPLYIFSLIQLSQRSFEVDMIMFFILQVRPTITSLPDWVQWLKSSSIVLTVHVFDHWAILYCSFSWNKTIFVNIFVKLSYFCCKNVLSFIFGGSRNGN